MSSPLEHVYRYDHASALVEDGASPRPRLALATSDAAGAAHPRFFEGRVLQPRLVAELLATLQLVVGSRFFIPPHTLARTIALADPVVTSGGGWLRFEGFSTCCSTYARVDLLPEALDGEIVGTGSTNVDFNAPMRAALAHVSDARGLSLSIGRDALSLRTDAREVVERKVALPSRWVRGLLEVQSLMAGMRPRLQVDALPAQRFLRALPRSSTSRTPLWVSAVSGGLATSTQASSGAVRVADLRRLRLLQALSPKVRRLAVHADPADQASAWVLDFGPARFTLALSAETWRGFSGEGQALRALMRHGDGEDAAAGFERLRAQLHWQPRLDADAIASHLSWTRAAVDDGLRVLGACGAVGFDVAEGAYFHRQLPLDLALVEDMHPRLRDARALLAAGAVRIERADPLEASVASDDIRHLVREAGGELHCTCPWFAKHRGERGPCKHVLAVEACRRAVLPDPP